MPQPSEVEALLEVAPEATASEFRGALRIVVAPQSLLAALRRLRDSCAMDMLVDVTCVDYLNYRGAEDRFGLVYLLASTTTNRRLTVRTFVNDSEPSVASAVGLWAGAEWLEREVWDLFGIRFEGHPDLRRIVMPEPFVGHPLRKDYPLQGLGERHNLPVIPRAES